MIPRAQHGEYPRGKRVFTDTMRQITPVPLIEVALLRRRKAKTSHKHWNSMFFIGFLREQWPFSAQPPKWLQKMHVVFTWTTCFWNSFEDNWEKNVISFQHISISVFCDWNSYCSNKFQLINYFEFAKQIKTNISIFCHNIIYKIAFFLDLKPDFCFLFWPMSMHHNDCYNSSYSWWVM